MSALSGWHFYQRGCQLASGQAVLWVSAELRQMRKNADASKAQQAQAEATMEQLERKAQRAYEQDVKDAEQTKAVTIGSWVRRAARECAPCLLACLANLRKRATAGAQVHDAASGYSYNAAQRYYFSRRA